MCGRKYFCLTVFVFIAIAGHNAFCHPVTFKGGTAITYRSLPGNVSSEINHTITPRWSIGMIGLNRDLSIGKTRAALLGTNVLVWRLNQMHSQTNVYLLGSAGGETSDLAEKHLARGGLQLDFETIRFYTALRAQHMVGQTDKWTDFTFRLGLAPFEADYKSLQTWLVGQFMFMETKQGQMLKSVALMRFFYRSALWEFGADQDGLPWIQLMVHI